MPIFGRSVATMEQPKSLEEAIEVIEKQNAETLV